MQTITDPKKLAASAVRPQTAERVNPYGYHVSHSGEERDIRLLLIVKLKGKRLPLYAIIQG